MAEPEEITIEIPDFARMTDEEVAAHPLCGLIDGRWSRLTKMLMEAWETDKLDLNDAWASTWQGWDCPACGRRKQEIARLSEGGVLLCKLTYHHDHLREVAKALFRATDPLPEERHARAARVRAKVAAYAMVERFAETLVCEDCNNADAEMKAALGATVDPFFSFSPREIGQFIRPEPYRSHTVDIESGKRVFATAGPAFAERVAFVRLLVDRVGRGLNDIEVAGALGEVPRSNERMVYRLAYDRAGPRSRMSQLYEALSDRSRAADGNQSNRRKRTRRQVAVPSPEEFATICARNAESPRGRRRARTGTALSAAERSSRFAANRTAADGRPRSITSRIILPRKMPKISCGAAASTPVPSFWAAAVATPCARTAGTSSPKP